MSRTAYPGTMAGSGELEIVLDGWARPEFPELYQRPVLDDGHEMVRLALMTGMITRDEARCLLGMPAS